MYTVPAKFPVRAKKLIESFEKGELPRRESDQADELDSNYHTEKYAINEQAMPGTTKKRLLELEQRKKLETERETSRSERRSSTTGKLSAEMFGDFASDRLTKGKGPQFYGHRTRNGSTNEVPVSDSGEVFLAERHENDARLETPEGVKKHEVESYKAGAAVLVVSCAGQSSSIIDRKLINVLANTIQESGRKILTTHLDHSDGMWKCNVT